MTAAPVHLPAGLRARKHRHAWAPLTADERVSCRAYGCERSGRSVGVCVVCGLRRCLWHRDRPAGEPGDDPVAAS